MGAIRDCASLMQCKIVALLLFSAIAGFAIAYQGLPDPGLHLALVAFGIALAGSGAEILNKVLERDVDSKMKRTSGRATVKEKINTTLGLALGSVLAAFGILLGYLVNYLTALSNFS